MVSVPYSRAVDPAPITWTQPGRAAQDRMWTHGVNLGQAMATWSAMYRLTGDKSYLTAGKAGWEKVIKYHGQASGVFTGDETLSGLTPSRGTETCTVVEIMNSAGEYFFTRTLSTSTWWKLGTDLCVSCT